MLPVTRERLDSAGVSAKEEPMPTEEDNRQELSFQQRLITDGFDEVAKELAAGTISRRRAIKLVGTALLGSGLLAMFPDVAGAQSSIVPGDQVSVAGHNNPGCQGEAAINNGRCPFNICGRKHRCVCATTTGGNKRCVSLRNEDCPRVSQCSSSAQCPGNQYCVRVGGCCGRGINACLKPCGG
jgi:hypothetical protein